jgi:uncharacterized membrane protein HdeD (DUF308 family)
VAVISRDGTGAPACWREKLNRREGGRDVITLGIILLIIGLIAKIAVLYSIGIVLLVVGLVLVLLGSMGRAVGGRRHFY